MDTRARCALGRRVVVAALLAEPTTQASVPVPTVLESPHRRRAAVSPIVESAILAVGRVGAAAIAILLPIALVRLLDPASIGRYKLLFLIASTLATLLSCGIPASLYFFLPRHPEYRRQLLRRSTLILLGAGVVSACMILAARPLLASHFHLSDQREVLFAAMFTAVLLPAALLSVIATTDGRVKLASLAIAGFDALRALTMLGAAFVYQQLDAVLLSAAAVTALQFVVLAVYVLRRPGPVHAPLPTTGAPSVGRAQMLYALSYQGAIVANLVREQAQSYYVAGVVPLSEYAVYAMGLLQIPFIGAVAQSLNDVLIVHGSAMHGRGDTNALLALWHRSVLVLALFAIPTFATFWVFAPELFLVLFGPVYAASVPVFRVSLFLLPMSVPLLHTMLRATGRTATAARAELLSLVVALGMLPVLVSQFGTLGAVVSLIAASVIFQLSGSSALCEELRRPPSTLLPWGALLLLLSEAAVSALVARALVASFAPATRLIVGIPLALAGCVTVAWFAGLIPEEDCVRVRMMVARGRRMSRRFLRLEAEP